MQRNKCVYKQLELHAQNTESADFKSFHIRPNCILYELILIQTDSLFC